MDLPIAKEAINEADRLARRLLKENPDTNKDIARLLLGSIDTNSRLLAIIEDWKSSSRTKYMS